MGLSLLADLFFAGSFIFYRPKDIVSGDFYWIKKKSNKVYIAAVDCTGHGVPGAFMTVLANTLLNQIIEVSDDCMMPDQVLSLLDMKVKELRNENVFLLQVYQATS